MREHSGGNDASRKGESWARSEVGDRLQLSVVRGLSASSTSLEFELPLEFSPLPSQASETCTDGADLTLAKS
jgi:hypothetical protein